MATQADLSDVMRGDTVVLNISIASTDITGDELWFTMKSCLADTDAAAALQYHETVPSGAPATGGLHTLTIPTTSTSSLTPGKYFYDVQWVDPSTTPSTVNTLSYGIVEVLEDVSISII